MRRNLDVISAKADVTPMHFLPAARVSTLLLAIIPTTSASVVPAPPRALKPITGDACALGFDFGTSGVRCAVVDAAGGIVASPAGYSWGDKERNQSADDWKAALFSQLGDIPLAARQRIERIAVSGTSGSILLVEEDGTPSRTRGNPRMYDFSVKKQAGEAGAAALKLLEESTPEGHTVRSATSALAKLLAYHLEEPLTESERLAHQADYCASLLTGLPPSSDWHNALKLGFDVRGLEYPEWMSDASTPIGAIVDGKLPTVTRPGEPYGSISSSVSSEYGLPESCVVVGGTTDSIAAFLAAGASEVGDAVSSLGSTLAIKLLSSQPVDDAALGVYSHRLGDRWLVGGASNTGCAILREEGFDADELKTLSDGIDPASTPVHTDYYPLSRSTVGERFPKPDENAIAMLTPKPDDRKDYLHCILYGVARVEMEAYQALASLGASPLERVLTSGGGSNNPQWTAMRERLLKVPTSQADNIDAAYGAALLAARGS